MTIREAIEKILANAKVPPIEGTVDTIKTGNPDIPLTGIVTTFLATYEVIERAAESGSNLIITHEPTFYNHRDEVDWLSGDPVYMTKQRLLDEHNIVIWRFHDYWHRVRPDGVLIGALKALGWEAYVDQASDYVCDIAPMSLTELVATLKEGLDIDRVRVVGAENVTCRRIALLPGSPSARIHITAFRKGGVDAVIAGEVNEWELCEYMRDAVRIGIPQALVIVGHEKSEEMGMRYLVDWLRPLQLGVPIQHIAAGEPFRMLA